MKALIIDDEQAARENLEILLSRYCPSIQVVGSANSVQAACGFLAKNDADILFLDITMPGGSGFDLLEKIKRENYLIVFVTAYEEFSLKALKLNAVEYVLKPINIDDLKACEKKLAHHFNLRKNSSDYNKIYADALDRILKTKKGSEENKKLVISHMQGYTVLDMKEIIYLEGDTSYTIFHTTNKGKIVASHNLKYFEEIIDESQFYRIHKSFIINMQHFKQYSNVDGYTAVMTDGNEIPISRRKLDAFHMFVQKYLHASEINSNTIEKNSIRL